MTDVPELQLQQIAAMKVAVCLWNHIDDLPGAFWQTSFSYKWFRKIPQLVSELTKQESMSLPNSIRELIVVCIGKVRVGAEQWILYHHPRICFRIHDEYRLLCHFGHIVWLPDGTVDNVGTARNIQSSIRLNEVEKFHFLCQYCLKDEIEPKWKLFLEKKIFDSVRFDEFPLLYYWDCYCRNRLQNVPVTEGLSIDESMFRHNKVDNWPAKEYFFDRMNVDEQIQNAIWIIDSQLFTFQKYVIGKLNPAQRSTLYMNRSIAILKNYFIMSGTSRQILQTWYETIEMITKDEFAELFTFFVRKTENPDIITEIWISAPDVFKLHVLNSNNANLINAGWKCWMEYYDRDLLQLLLNASTNIREGIKTKKIFNDHCKSLMVKNKLATLISVLTLCFKSSELVSAKRTFFENDWFDKHFQNLLAEEKFSSVKQLCDFFSDAIDVNKFKGDIVKKSYFKNQCADLVKKGKIAELEELLNVFFSNVEEAKKSVRDHLIDKAPLCSLCENSTVEYTLPKLDEILNFFGFDAEKSVQFKQSLIAKPLFADHCLNLISRGEVSNLQKFLIFFPCIEEAVKFERSLKEKILSGRYHERWILGRLDGQKALKRVLKCFRLNDEELACFKENHFRGLANSNEYIRAYDFFKSFLFASPADVYEFKRNIARKDGQAMIINHDLSQFKILLNKLCYFSPREPGELKVDMTEEPFFIDHCSELIKSDELLKLNKLLRFCFDESRMFRNSRVIGFKHKLAELKIAKERCLGFFAAENSKELDDLLTFFFHNDSKLVLDYKRNLLMSEQGIEVCFGLVDRPKKIFRDMIGKRLPYDSLIDFEREIIFSPAAISSLKNMMQKNQIGSAAKCINRFSNCDKDKKLLKTRLLDNPGELITAWFFKLDQNICEFSAKWWFPDAKAVREFKSGIALDEVFEAGLKECLFQSFDSSGQVSDCVLKKDLNLKPLDRFLSWYFESPKKVKEYKVRKIRDEDMETINFLLKNDAEISYFNELLNWFFETDALEILKFNKNRVRKLPA